MEEKHEEHFVGLVVQKAVIEKAGKILMIKNKGDELWDFPGGRLNLYELPIDGLARELLEEIGCKCTIGPAIYTNQYIHHATQKPMFLVVYTVSMEGGCSWQTTS